MRVVYLLVCRRGRTIIIVFVGYVVDSVIIVVIVIRVDFIMRFMIFTIFLVMNVFKIYLFVIIIEDYLNEFIRLIKVMICVMI